jgi:RNA polymerase sigma-70 factor (ECF subfamily)
MPSYRPGNADDFDRLYRDSYARILRTLLGVLGDPAAAEDCAQETFVRAYQAWSRWRPDAPAEAWLHRIGLRVAFSHRRRERLREVSNLVRRLGRPASAVDPTEASPDSDLLSALRRLPPAQAAAIVLRHHHGYSNREIAAALGVPESTVSSRLTMAKDRLRHELGDAGLDSSLQVADEPTRYPAAAGRSSQ